ncbi:hypothetical protein GJAV_G00250010 [Gymnothorax javanicus]|nr:hypothetical protein GJAV_G00250010 [Gymnothorax javanicus]
MSAAEESDHITVLSQSMCLENQCKPPAAVKGDAFPLMFHTQRSRPARWRFFAPRSPCPASVKREYLLSEFLAPTPRPAETTPPLREALFFLGVPDVAHTVIENGYMYFPCYAKGKYDLSTRLLYVD